MNTQADATPQHTAVQSGTLQASASSTCQRAHADPHCQPQAHLLGAGLAGRQSVAAALAASAGPAAAALLALAILCLAPLHVAPRAVRSLQPLCIKKFSQLQAGCFVLVRMSRGDKAVLRLYELALQPDSNSLLELKAMTLVHEATSGSAGIQGRVGTQIKAEFRSSGCLHTLQQVVQQQGVLRLVAQEGQQRLEIDYWLLVGFKRAHSAAGCAAAGCPAPRRTGRTAKPGAAPTSRLRWRRCRAPPPRPAPSHPRCPAAWLQHQERNMTLNKRHTGFTAMRGQRPPRPAPSRL